MDTRSFSGALRAFTLKRAVTITCIPTILVLSSCYHVIAGAPVAVNRLPGSERVVRELGRHVTVVNPPVVGPSTVLTFRIVATRQVEFREQTAYQALHVESRGGKLMAGLAWSAIGAAGISYAARTRDAQGDTLTTAGAWSAGGGIAALLLGLRYLFDAASPSNPKILPGKTVLSPPRTDSEVVQKGVPQMEIHVRANGVEHDYLTDTGGAVQIDLARDFDVRYYEHPETIHITAWTTPTDTVSVSRNVGDILPPCVRTLGTGFVFREARATAGTLGEFSAHEIFRLRSSISNGYFGIEYHGSEGWIARLLARRCWGVPSS